MNNMSLHFNDYEENSEKKNALFGLKYIFSMQGVCISTDFP